jgi:hypothetical protein
MVKEWSASYVPIIPVSGRATFETESIAENPEGLGGPRWELINSIMGWFGDDADYDFLPASPVCKRETWRFQ